MRFKGGKDSGGTSRVMPRACPGTRLMKPRRRTGHGYGSRPAPDRQIEIHDTIGSRLHKNMDLNIVRRAHRHE
jgi:hypothetical protein